MNPMVDRADPLNQVLGARQRILRELPPAEPAVYRRLKRYTSLWCRRHLKPIRADADMSIEAWLPKTHYPEWRKKQLMRAYESSILRPDSRAALKKLYGVKAHIKAETYPTYKHSRWILARSDYAKCMFGPMCKLMEEEIFQLPMFVKHIPIADRPSYISERLGAAGPFYETDYTAFESHFIAPLMNACEMVVYKYLLANFPREYNLFHRVLTGVNKPRTTKVSLTCRARRMSGEMNTSMGNGLSNAIIAEFIAFEKGGSITGVFEGDDGLFVSHNCELTPEDYKKVGLTIKFDKVFDFGEASFCGFTADPTELQTISDPYRRLPYLGWTLSPRRFGGVKVLEGLLKSKMMSLGCELPQCPIYWALSKTIVNHLSKVKRISDWNYWEQEKLASEPVFNPREPGPLTRNLYAIKYGVSVDHQLTVEKYLLHRKDPCAPLPHWILPDWASKRPQCLDY